MRIFSDYLGLPPEAKGSVIALGNFDGVHLGHAGVLAEARAFADSLPAPLGVLTFEPHPRTVFRPADPPFRLTTREAKARLMARHGVDNLYVMPFSREFSLKSTVEFQRGVLLEGLGIRGAIAGANFRFGHNRAGTLAELRRFGMENGFEVREASNFADGQGEAYSSTRIRHALSAARPDEAARLLGRLWKIDCLVERGDQRGRQLGYPTANGQLGELLRPAFGIYAVLVGVDGDTAIHHGVASIGIRPMWESEVPLIETHIFDFDRDIYGRHIRVALAEYLRPEAKFASIDALIGQMAADCREARLRLEKY